MAFTQFGFIQLDPNAPDSTTCQILTERHGPAGLAVFVSVMCLMGKKSDREARISFVAREIATMAGCPTPDAVAVLKTWSETSEARGDGFRFVPDNEAAGTWSIHWPEFEERHGKIYSNRRNGDKPKASHPEATAKPTESQPEAKPKQSRVEKSREENTNPPTPLAGGRGVFDAYAPDPNVSGALLQEAQFCLPAIKKLCGRLHQRELPGALEKIALVIADLAEAGIPSPTQAVIRTLENWPANIPRSIGIVKQRLHEQVMAASQPPEEEPYDPIWDPLPKD